MMKKWVGFASQNLLRLRRKTRFARLHLRQTRAFGTQYSRFALVAYFSQTVLNRVFDKDYNGTIQFEAAQWNIWLVKPTFYR